MKLCSGYTNAFTIDASEFDRCLPADGQTLYKDDVFVFWKWKWEGWSKQDESGSSDEDSVVADDEGSSSDQDGGDTCDDDFDLSMVTHSVVFKCVGVTKELHSQEVLAEAAQKLKKQEHVEVRLRTEPTNPKDSRAIAFDCRLTNDWELIGYVVREALDSLHQALQTDSITSVQFAWIRFITHWSRSGPGWYCGIKITRKGEWPKEVVRCGSTV